MTTRKSKSVGTVPLALQCYDVEYVTITHSNQSHLLMNIVAMDRTSVSTVVMSFAINVLQKRVFLHLR
jgi:hypothetical protein